MPFPAKLWVRGQPRRSIHAGLFLLSIFQASVNAAPPPEGVAPVIDPAGGFGIDGDLFARQPTAASGDWVIATNLPGSGAGLLAPDGTPLDPTATFHFIDPFNDKDNDKIFTGGSKWEDDPNDWGWVTGKPSSKADINNLLFHVASDYEGHTWLVMAADRATTQGDSYIDFELLQNPLVRTEDGRFVSAGPHGGRTTNDLVLSLAFDGGGKVADFLAWRWEPDGAGGYHYVDRTSDLPPGRVFVALNSNTIATPYSVFGAMEYQPNAFVEAAIDLTATVEGVEPCETFGFVAIMVKTKSSTSDSAGIEDFLDPIAYNFRSGPQAEAGPDQTLCAEAGGTGFALSGSASAGLAPVVSTRWTVVSGAATLTDSNALATTALVYSPTATLRLDVTQLNGCSDSDEVVLTTVPPPTADILGPSSLCPGATAEFSGPTGMDGYQWSVSGNASILSSSNADTVTVLSGGACGEPFALTLLVSSNICTATSTAEVAVVDDTPPVLTAGADRTVECGQEWSFDPVSAVDDCAGTNVLVEILGTVTNPLVGETFRATRTWQATDGCGNTSTASQTVTIVDTTPPQIVCPSNVVVECAGPSRTEAFFAVTASDVCDSNVTVVCSPPSGTRFPFGETTVDCTATDDSGNTSQCSFLVIVQDTTPPEITCPADIVQNTDPGLCEAAIEPGFPDATDVCAEVTVEGARSDGLSLTNAYPKGVTLITWTATDAVGLTSTCTQTVTVVDNEPPVVSCPPDLTVAEAPRDSGSARVEFSEPLASDNCSSAPGVVCVPPSGSLFPVGETTVQCVATDEAGNTNGCSFTVRVVPYRLTVTQVGDSGAGSLRQALLDANAGPGENRIEFSIPGPGPYTIQPETNLPVITSAVVLDGKSQPGFGGTPVIELDGGLAGGGLDGLVFLSESNIIQSLALFGFDTAISFGTNSGGSIVRGSFVGVDSSGTNVIGNHSDGVWIASAANLIGGTGPTGPNWIAGNRGNGIRLSSTHARNNKVLGNLIGVWMDELTPAPNSGAGILLEDGASDNQIGSVALAEANRIGYNAGAGIALGPSAGTGNRIGINRIQANTGLGIDLMEDGVTLNDPEDSDTGPNGLQNFPALTDARSVDGITTVEGSLTTVPNQTYRLDFYLNDVADPTGYGEGQTYLGFASLPVGATGTVGFSVSFATPALFTQFVTATATDPLGNSSEFSQALQVRTPPVAGQSPSNTNVVAGSTVTLCADASGTPPIFYQWRLNGANIPGETNQCITLTDVEAQDAGAFSVIVYNGLGGFGTPPANLLVPITNAVSAHDNFADRQSLEALTGETQGSNRGATREAGEPLHAGKPGGSSVWYSMVAAPDKGIMTIGTRGSTFDTLLGVYTGDSVSNLTAVSSDEDRGGFFTSSLRFNAIKDTEYAIAVDGYAGDSGDFVLSWTFEETPHLLPVFLQQPQSVTVSSNGIAKFTSQAALVCGNGVTNCPSPSHYPNGIVPGLFKQWYFQGIAIPGATNASLTISNVQPADLGEYWVEATARYYIDGVDRTIRSDAADLQINRTGQGGLETVQAKDKLPDALLSPPWVIGGVVPASPPSTNVLAASGLTSGYTGTQIFNTTASSSSSGETTLCGFPGGSSEWVTLVSQADGMLAVDTAGSDYDTLMAVYALTPSNTVQELDCNDNATTGGGTYSQLAVPIKAGDTNIILVDGKYAASGTLVLNYSLIAPATLQAVGPDGIGGFRLRVVGYPGMNLTLESSSNLRDWTPLLSTNSLDEAFDYTDPVSSLSSGKYYRAVLTP